MLKKIFILAFPVLLFVGLAVKHASAGGGLILDGGGDSAIGSSSPLPNSLKWNPSPTSYPGSSNFSGADQPYYDVGNNKGIFDYQNAKIKLYMKPGSSMVLNVSNAGPDCHNWSNGGLVGPDYAQNATDGGPRTTFEIVKESTNSVIGSIKTADVYDDCTFSAAFNVPANSGDTDTNGVGGYTQYLFLEVNTPQNQTILGENSFWVYSNSTDDPVGYSDALTGYGYRAQNLNDGNVWTNEIVFGVNQTCSTLGQSQPGTITYADADANNTSWNPNIQIQLQEEKNGTSNNWQTVINRGTAYLQSNESGTLYSGSFDPTFRYRVILQNVGVKNTIFLRFQGGISQMAGHIGLTQADCTGSVACSATASPATPKLNQAVQVTVKATNTSASGGPTFPTTYQLRQVAYSSGPAGGAQTLPSALAPGNSENVGPYNINARASPQTVTFYYQLFNGTSASSGLIGPSPPCHVTVTWSSNPGAFGTMTLNCSAVNITLNTKATDWYWATQQGSGYYTNESPNAGPDTWDHIPLPATPQPPEPPAVPGNDYTGPDPLFPGITDTWYWFGTYRYQQPETPATVIPYYIQFYDSNGNPVGTYNNKIQPDTNNGNGTASGSVTIDTFNTAGPFLWPHQVYSAALFAEVQTSDFFYRDGPYPGTGTWTPITGPVPLIDTSYNNSDTCLHASANTACVGPSTDPGPVEPGQNFTFTYGVQLTNDTQKTFSGSDPNGYNFAVSTSGGLNYLGGVPASAGSISPGTNTITVTIPARVDYTGGFGVTFRFQGTQLAVDDWNGSCGVGGPGTPGSDTPATRPYFQVWNSNTSAGGGFSSPAGACPTTSPGYISPVTSSGNQYAGGVRAYGAQTPDRGSRADFGVIALGLIQGSPGGPVGFYSGDTANSLRATFANYGVSQMGGHLNSNSSSHCVDDYFTKTRTSSTLSGFPGFAGATASGQYSVSPGSFLSGGTLAQNQQLTIYVDGNVTINSNINYPASFNPSDQTQIPYFALIVRGNISLGAGVTHLDGLYVAQPTTTGSGGVFATCNATCNSQLVINGAVIAQHVELLRSHGTLGPQVADINGIGNNPAEIINYVPSMLIGTPFFASSFGNLEGIFSLPPVF